MSNDDAAESASSSPAPHSRAAARRLGRPIQSRAAHRLLHAMLAREGLDPSLRLVPGPDGKPLLYRQAEPSPIAVALSHSRTVAACAITDLGVIGIDVEFRAERPFQALAATAFGPAEQRVVAQKGRSAFYRIWTLREALAKAPLDGLARLTDGRDYFADAPDAGSWRTVIDNQEWLFWTGVRPDNYAIAVGVASRSPLPAVDPAALPVEPFNRRRLAGTPARDAQHTDYLASLTTVPFKATPATKAPV